MTSMGDLRKILSMRYAMGFFGNDDSGSGGVSIHADGDCGGYSIFLHGYTDKVVGSRHGVFVMGYEYDLGLCRDVFQQFPEERYICIVEGRICLIEYQEGRRTVQEDGEYQCHGGEGLFTSGQ